MRSVGRSYQRGADPDPSLDGPESFDNAFLTKQAHQRTLLQIGYTDRLENLGLYDGVVRPIGFPSTTTARQFFAKVSYLIRF